MPSQSLFLWNKKGVLGVMVSSQAEDGEETSIKNQLWPKVKDLQGSWVGAFTAALDVRTVWPGFLLQAAQEGDEMANVGVPFQSQSPHGPTRSGGALSSGGC